MPGVREIRSALAGGYLWIVFLWLALDPGLGKSDFDREPYQSAHHLGNDIGPVALGVALTFAAYLIGTFFNETRTVIARIYLGARRSASGNAPAERRAKVLKELGEERRKRRRLRRQARLRRLRNRRKRRRRVVQQWNDLSRPDMATIGYALARGLVNGVALLGDIVERFLMVPTLLVDEAIDSSEGLQEWLLAGIRRLSSIRIEPYKPFVSEDGVAAIERYLNREQTARAGYDYGGGSSPYKAPTVADVISDFPIIRNRLIHKSPDTVSEYDRLRAEADFRSAIVPPLVAIIAIFVLEVSWIWSLAALLLLVLLGTARTKRREGGDLLADNLGVVDAPCVEGAGNTKLKEEPTRLAAPD